MSRSRDAAAVAGAAAVLLLAEWLDTSVIPGARQASAATFELSGMMTLISVGSIAVAAGCLCVAWLGSRAAPLVGVLYALVGGLLALLPWLAATFASQVNGAPPIAPDLIARALGKLVMWTEGPLNAVGIVGGAMLIAGLVSIVGSLRGRRGRAVAVFPTAGVDL